MYVYEFVQGLKWGWQKECVEGKLFPSKGKNSRNVDFQGNQRIKYFGKQSQRFSVNIVRLFAVVFAGTTVFNIEC